MLIKTPKVIYDHLDKYIVGQESVKTMLSNLYFLHSLRAAAHKTTGRQFKKSVGLIYGPSGCGKSYSIDILAKAAKLPYFKVNAKDITLPGYKGSNLDEHLGEFVNKYRTSPLKDDIPYGIFHIDEFDKIANDNSPGSRSSDWDTHLQYNLLSFVEGAELTARTEKAPKSTVKTHNMLIILTGSFAHLDSERRIESSKDLIGFGPSKLKEPDKAIQKLLIEGGMIKELVGRVTSIAKVDKLTKKEAKEAFLSKKDSIYKQYKYLLEDLCDFNLSSQKINKIVDSAINSDIGARGLQAALEKELESIIFNCKPSVGDINDEIIEEEIDDE